MRKVTFAEAQREITSGDATDPWRYGKALRCAPVLGVKGPVGSALAWALAKASYSGRFLVRGARCAAQSPHCYRSPPEAPIVVYGPTVPRPAAELKKDGSAAGHWLVLVPPASAKLLAWAGRKAVRRLQRQTGLSRGECERLISMGFLQALQSAQRRDAAL